MNSMVKAANEKAGQVALMLMLLTPFIFTAGTSVLLQAQTGSADAQLPTVTHNAWKSGAAMPTALKFAMRW